MNKNLIYPVVIVLIGLAVFFFVQKSRNVSNNSGIEALNQKPTESVNGNQLDASDKSESESGNWVELENGLKYKDVAVGTGQEAKNGDAVAAHYIGTLENGSKFDSSYDRGQPFAFLLGGGQVIKGWDLGIAGMKVGGKRKLVIPPELGYGSRDVGDGKIPPNSTLFFDVELIAVQTPETQ